MERARRVAHRGAFCTSCEEWGPGAWDTWQYFCARHRWRRRSPHGSGRIQWHLVRHGFDHGRDLHRKAARVAESARGDPALTDGWKYSESGRTKFSGSWLANRTEWRVVRLVRAGRRRVDSNYRGPKSGWFPGIILCGRQYSVS